MHLLGSYPPAAEGSTSALYGSGGMETGVPPSHSSSSSQMKVVLKLAGSSQQQQEQEYEEDSPEEEFSTPFEDYYGFSEISELVVSIPLVLLRPPTPSPLEEEPILHSHEHRHHKPKKHKKHKKPSSREHSLYEPALEATNSSISHTPSLVTPTSDHGQTTPLSGKHLSFSQAQKASPFKFTISKSSSEESPLLGFSSSSPATPPVLEGGEKRGHAHKHKKQKHHHHHQQSSPLEKSQSISSLERAGSGGVRGVYSSTWGHGVSGGKPQSMLFSSPEDVFVSDSTSQSFSEGSQHLQDTSSSALDLQAQSQDIGKARKKKKKKHKHHALPPTSSPPPAGVPLATPLSEGGVVLKQGGSPPPAAALRKRRRSEPDDAIPPAKQFRHSPSPTPVSRSVSKQGSHEQSHDSQPLPPPVPAIRVTASPPRPAPPPKPTPPPVSSQGKLEPLNIGHFGTSCFILYREHYKNVYSGTTRKGHP